MRSGFDTRNREEGEALVAAAYAENRLRVTGGSDGFRMTQDRIDIGEIQFDHYSNTLTHDFDVDPLETLTVLRVLERTVSIDTAAHSARACPGDVMLLTLPGESYRTVVDGARTQATLLSFGLLDQVGDEPGAALARRYRTDPIAPAAAKQWVRTVDYITETVLSADAITTPLVLDAASRMLSATFVAVFDPEAGTVRSEDRVDAVPAAVRRATAFIESNPDLEIGVADIARAAHVSVRSLQLAFRRHLHTTPMRYLRRVRLELARADLLRAVAGDATTVTGVALRWGFADMSRFAADYRAAYGEPPHHTLRRLGH
ncbi:helix-turn-helix transcriptional regulator [Nocardia sp. NPDC055321]